jgi:hypothetical protein
VLREGAPAPASAEGKRLMAHELAHVVQQGAAGAGGPVVRRAVSPRYKKIYSNLTYGVFDWAITDGDAHEVLDILGALNPTDLADTVRAMESADVPLVDRLFDNVSDKDRDNRADLLERIHRVRVHRETRNVGGKDETTEAVGPCNQGQSRTLQAASDRTADWAGRARDAVATYIAAPGTKNTGALLERHFFHEANRGVTLTPAQRASYAEQVRTRLDAVAHKGAFTLTCASQFDPLCRSMAELYTNPDDGRTATPQVTACPSFFDSTEDLQTDDLLHEFVHAFTRTPGVGGQGAHDRAYSSERIYAYLTPERAIDNADSFARFVLDVIHPHGLTSANLSGPPVDSVSDCGPREGQLRREVAVAARMLTNAINVIGDPAAAAVQGYTTTYFKVSTRSDLNRFIDRLKELKTNFRDGLNLECESSCDSGTLGYWRHWGWTVHVCPPYFAIATEAGRVDQILLLAIMERLGKHDGPMPGTAAFAAQTADAAYNNPEAYAGYIRTVSDHFFGP